MTRRHDYSTLETTIESILQDKDSHEFHYRMLSRLQSDCYYFIEHGGANSLWYKGEPVNHAKLMVAIWDSLPVKPEWLTREKLKDFYYSLTKTELSQ